MAFLHQGTVCSEVTVHSIISTGQTAAPDDAEAAPNCCLITQKKRTKKKTFSPPRLKPRIRFKDSRARGSGETPRSLWERSVDVTLAEGAAVFMMPANNVHMCGRVRACRGGHVQASMSKCAGIKIYSIWT